MTARTEATADPIRRRLLSLAEQTSAPGFAEFLEQYYQFTAPEDLSERTAENLYGAALTHWQLGQQRVVGTPAVRVFNPTADVDGWQSRHTVVQIVTDDMPFLVDSVSMELSRHNRGIHLVVQPVVTVLRNITGELLELLPPWSSGAAVHPESFLNIEFDRIGDAEGRAALHVDLLRVLGDVRAAVEDWQKMRARMRGIVDDELTGSPPVLEDDDVAESRELLRWIAAEHFTFLGYREYDLVTEADGDVLKPILGTGLGLLRDVGYQPKSTSFAKLPPSVRARVRERRLLVLTKANTRSTVHRPSYLDYVGVKRFDADGNVVGERRFLGLYTSVVYATSPREIPLLRRKVSAVIERAALPPGGHLAKALADVLESYPRDELFQANADQLFETAMGVVQLQERQRVRVFVRPDTFGRFVSFLVYLPRDRYTTAARLQVQRVLMDAYRGSTIDYYVALSESVLVRIHFVVYVEEGELAQPDLRDLERRVATVTRSWTDDLRDALCESLDESRALELFDKFRGAFPAAYQEDFAPRETLGDLSVLARLNPAGDLASELYQPEGSLPGTLRFKVFRTGSPLAVSDVLPLLQNLGVRVLDERPYSIRRHGTDSAWIYDFGLAPVHGRVDVSSAGSRFERAFTQIWRGAAEDDGFNRLVLVAGLEWRDVVVIRAYARYQRQTAAKYTQPYVEESLVNNPHIAAMLVELFRLRFAPGDDKSARETAVDRVAGKLGEALDAVVALDEDRILRSLVSLVQATVRTNGFQLDEKGGFKPYLALKFDSVLVPDLPLPRPLCEIFVYSPRVEAVHLRGGKVARGGIRWSDRREDFRTEVLGLMKAQMVKNAVIVPVGAKGGFVVKRPASTDLMSEVIYCYTTMMRGLLDLTDNIAGGRIVPPHDVVRYDDDDPYLVVAADKGTASFSDIANSVAAEYRFWLGDAFASGGSSGYDHKKMGITARGAWESTRRHLREIGVDSQTSDFTVVGIGDMSGDVFGNAMLLSRHIRLVAAFDHRHVFLDPAPDAAASFVERHRLFYLPRSSWADYDQSLLSEGGGVFARSAKSIALSAQARAALGIDADAMTPEELIRAILSAPVDLLFNGGIGTYVKASAESHADVGDRGTDALRIDAAQLRCLAVVEGGNLGLTQLARVEYALGTGRIFSDAIDNSAGVDCSDHEVNIKVLLGAAVTAGKLTIDERDVLLVQMTDEVADLVLRDNYSQTRVLSMARVQAPEMAGVYSRFIRGMEDAGRLNRSLEHLPSDAALEERRAAGLGMTTPEFAVLLAYTKIGLYTELLDSDVPEDPYLSQELAAYFPEPLRAAYAEERAGHPLRREIVATAITNGVVNRAGITFVFRLAEETGVAAPELVRAHRAAREIFAMRDLWAQIERLDDTIPAEVQYSMQLETRRVIERAARWLVRHGSHLDVARTVAEFAPGIAAVAERLPSVLTGVDKTAVDIDRARFEAAGAPAQLAATVASLGPLFSGLDICTVAAATHAEVRDVTSIYFGIADPFGLSWLRARISELPRSDRWQTLARAALRDDMNSVHASLVTDVLRTGAGAPAAEAVESWRAERAAALERVARVFSEIKAGGVADLATLSVAAREVRTLLA
ncbi:MAG: NAD-glutamate dehydrogenase [Actinomycetota bacterium]